MGLFVMQFTVNRIQNTISKDKAMLNAYLMGGRFNTSRPKMVDGKPITPSVGLPFYNSKKMVNSPTTINGNYMWLFK